MDLGVEAIGGDPGHDFPIALSLPDLFVRRVHDVANMEIFVPAVKEHSAGGH